jgi:hypothetical protein
VFCDQGLLLVNAPWEPKEDGVSFALDLIDSGLSADKIL